jgi:SAM-dependent methyltransferase
MDEDTVKSFWASNPCGERFIDAAKRSSYEQFFAEYDRFRYGLESHIPRCLDEIDFAGKRVLEIGLGLGADAEQIIRRGARWNGVDLTQQSVDHVETRLALRDLPFESLQQASALDLPFPDDHFDIVYSHGVFHHIPDVERAQTELARVVKPVGRVVLMLYATRSLNYLVSIALIRRVGLLGLYALSQAGIDVGGMYGEHVDNARREGLLRYLRLQNLVHRSTDGPSSPYSKVYTVAEVRRDFRLFEIERVHKEFMHAPPLPVHRLPFARILGWHLWVHLRPAVRR